MGEGTHSHGFVHPVGEMLLERAVAGRSEDPGSHFTLGHTWYTHDREDHIRIQEPSFHNPDLPLQTA